MNRIATLVLILVPCLSAYSQVKGKDSDVVVMKNGDHFTGTVKKLENGALYVDLPYVSGTIQLDWLKVDKVQSSGQFQVTLENGTRSAGQIKKLPSEQPAKDDFVVTDKNGEHHSGSENVIQIESQKENFWRQLTGALDVGYSYTSGNSQTSVTSDASANYVTTRWLAGATSTTSFSGQTGTSRTNLIEIQGQGGIFLNHNSYLLGLGDFLHSSQQSLALRTTLGGGYAHFFVRNNHNNFIWVAGAVYTHEKFDTSAQQQPDQNVEGLVGLQYQLYHFDRYQLQSQLYTYPGLSDFGRLRATPKITFTVKLPNNFHTDFSFWDNYDSRPPPNSKGNELGISNSLGWSF